MGVMGVMVVANIIMLMMRTVLPCLAVGVWLFGWRLLWSYGGAFPLLSLLVLLILLNSGSPTSWHMVRGRLISLLVQSHVLLVILLV